MIPYDDLVAALASWRTRQGLPVATSSVPGARAIAVTPTTPRAVAAPPQQAARPGPPGAPPRGVPLPAPVADDYDDAALIEAAYDPAGDDYVLPLGGDAVEVTSEPTAIGGAPEMSKSGKRRNDW